MGHLMKIFIVGLIAVFSFRIFLNIFRNKSQGKLLISQSEKSRRKEQEGTIRIGLSQINMNIGMQEPICPSCGVYLDKFSKSKIICRECGNIIYKKMRPWDYEKVFLSEKELIEFKENVWRYRFIKRYPIPDYSYYENILKKERNVQDVFFEDVVIFKYQFEKRNLAERRKWHDYCIVNNQLLCVYMSKGDSLEALKCGLEGAYIDFCRPRSNINETGFFTDEENMRFFFEPNIYDCRLKDFVNNLNLSQIDIKNIFYNLPIHSLYSFPLTKEDAWEKCILPWYKSIEFF